MKVQPVHPVRPTPPEKPGKPPVVPPGKNKPPVTPPVAPPPVSQGGSPVVNVSVENNLSITVNVNAGREGHGHHGSHHRPYGFGRGWGRLQQEMARAEVIGILFDHLR